MKKVNVLSVFLVILGLIAGWVPDVCFAGSADVVPKGVSMVNLHMKHYLPIDTQFDPDGNKEPVDVDFNATLDSNIFPGIIPPGDNIGDTIVDFEYEQDQIEILYSYGLTDRLTMGIVVPYIWNETNLKEARVDTSGATQNGLDTVFGPGLTPGDPTTDAIVTAGVFGIMEGFPYFYDPFESVSDSGLGDLEVGLKYQYYNDEDWALALTSALRLPTGEEDNPDDLLDLWFGSGTTSLLLRLDNDYKSIDRVTLSASLQLEFPFEDETTLRILNDPNEPLAFITNREKITRQYGNVVSLYLSGSYALSDAWGLSLQYNYGHHDEVDISGDLGLDYSTVEEETKQIEHVYFVGVSYSTIARYMETKKGIPLTALLTYRERFAGENVFNSQYISLDFSVYF